MTSINKFTVIGLSNIEALELEELLEDSSVELLSNDTLDTGQRHGDLGLTAVLIVGGTAAIHGLAVWLAKHRVRVHESKDITFTCGADGSVTLHIHCELSGKESSPPDDLVVEALKVDLSEALAAVR